MRNAIVIIFPHFHPTFTSCFFILQCNFLTFSYVYFSLYCTDNMRLKSFTADIANADIDRLLKAQLFMSYLYPI